MPSISVTGSAGIRAGFWRRFLSRFLDVIIVWLPFQIIAAFLFAATSGWVHETGGITFTTCVLGEQIPSDLVPPPPVGSNFSRECHVYFFGMETARYVQVGRATREGTTTKRFWRSYTLDREGHPISGVSLDWFAIVAFIAYVIAMETRTGATLGSRATRIRVRNTAAPDVTGVPLRKIIVRYVGLFLGLGPPFAIFLIYFVFYGGDLEAMFDSKPFLWAAAAATVLGLGWTIVLIAQMIAKHDPIYDRIAGTAVVRTST
jgi:uncharacterized RDD family membrane protein YckC